MSIETNPQGWARYIPLAENPIYYLNAIQYVGGSLYRAALGYETIWDKDFEEKLILALDAQLNYLAERRRYYIDQVKVIYDVKMKCLKWKNGIKPPLYFKGHHTETFKKGTRLTVRVNTVDTPNHVDIEVDATGEIFTVSYLYYHNSILRHLRSLTHANPTQSKQGGASAPNGKRGETSKAQAASSEIPSWDLPDNVLDLRQRLRRITSLREAHKKASTNLV